MAANDDALDRIRRDLAHLEAFLVATRGVTTAETHIAVRLRDATDLADASTVVVDTTEAPSDGVERILEALRRTGYT
jgi:hypothetical protein